MTTKEEIFRMIEEEGVEFIRLQFSDIFGRLKNIAVTPGQMEKVLNNRYSFAGSAAFGDRYRFDDKLYLYPDLDTFIILPWRPQQGKVAKIVCDICRKDGSYFDMCSRNVLKNVLKDIEAKGYKLMVDPECEFFLFHTDENGQPTTIAHETGGYLDVGPVDFGENARREIVLMLEEMGFVIESSHHEHGMAQHEIDFAEDEALKMADSIQTFKFAVRSIAKRFGLYATFMAKPKNDVAGSGMHLKLTLLKDGKNAFVDEDGELSTTAYQFMAGIMNHAKALAAFANPTVNSYKRLLSGFEAPNIISWSRYGERSLINLDNEGEDTKMELRFPDGTANPYLLIATCIRAGFDGIDKAMDPGKEFTDDSDYVNAEHLPENLKDAISCLYEDQVVFDAIGKEYANIFCEIKKAEWNDYMKEVSDWEINRYLTRI